MSFDVVLLPDHMISVLRSLPDPAEPLKGGVRAGEVRLSLGRLEAYGYAESRKGWWRKTRTGVMYLREVDRAASPRKDDR